jgi:hypothetical protein
MSQPAAKPHESRSEPIDRRADEVLQFLVRDLPPEQTTQAPYLATAIKRYDRYTEKKEECLDYAARRSRLSGITRTALELVSDLSTLDILSRDTLARRIEPTQIEALAGSLVRLGRETRDLANEIQENGRPRDVAEEQWIIELADIYENAFGRPASVSGAGDEPIRRRGKFYRLLELSRPASFPRHGKLSLRHIDRILKERKRRRRGSLGLLEAIARLKSNVMTESG